MAMIFDRFETRESAESFGATVKEKFGKDSTVHADQASSDEVDPFPYVLDGFIVLVERDYENYSDETEIQSLVGSFGGKFAGT